MYSEDGTFIDQTPHGPIYTEQGWTRSKVTMKDAQPDPGYSEPNAILDMYSNPQTRTIIISDSQVVREDKIRALRWSDMVMDNWNTVAGTGARDLQFMVWDNIKTNPSDTNTESIIDFTVDRARADGADVSTVQTFRRSSVGPERINYQLIAGTPHGDRVLKMLTDYHVRMGNLNIEAFHVYKPGMKNGPNSGKEYAIIIEFGR